MAAEVKFGIFAPDLPAMLGEGENYRSPRIVNAIPGALGYYPFPSASLLSSTGITGTPKGGAAMRKADNSSYVVLGSDTRLYQYAGGGFTNVTRTSGGDYAVPTDEIWRFQRHGDLLIATNIADHVQSVNINAGGNFANHFTSTLKPKARYVCAIGEFLVFAYVNENGTLYPRRVRWTSINNNADIDPSVANQSDKQDFLDTGIITGVFGNKQYGVIQTEDALHRMDYVGGQEIFSIQKIDGSVGTQVPNASAGYDKDLFYYSPIGFHRYNGSAAQPIGTEQIDAFFSKDLDYGNRHRIRAAIDPTNKLYVVAYPGAGNIGGRPNKMLVYRWDLERWGYIESIALEVLFQYLAQGLTLEQLDNISTSIDNLPASLDSPSYSDGRSILAGVNESGQIITFNGAPMTAELDTCEMSLTPHNLSHIRIVRPAYEGTSTTVMTLALLGRNIPQGSEEQGTDDGYTISDFMPIEETGEVNFEDLDSFRYHRFRMRLSGGFKHAKGIADIQLSDDGVL